MKSIMNIKIINAMVISYLLVACGQVPAFKPVRPDNKAATKTNTKAPAQNTATQNQNGSTSQDTTKTVSTNPQVEQKNSVEKQPGVPDSLPPPVTKSASDLPIYSQVDEEKLMANREKFRQSELEDMKSKSENKKSEFENTKSQAENNQSNLENTKSKTDNKKQVKNELTNKSSAKNEESRKNALMGIYLPEKIKSLQSPKYPRSELYESTQKLLTKIDLMKQMEYSKFKELTESGRAGSFHAIDTFTVSNIIPGKTVPYIKISANPIVAYKVFDITAVVFDGKKTSTLEGVLIYQNVIPKLNEIKSPYKANLTGLKKILNDGSLRIGILKLEGIPDQISIESNKQLLFVGEQNGENAHFKIINSLTNKLFGETIDLTSATSGNDVLSSLIHKDLITLSLAKTQIVKFQNGNKIDLEAKEADIATLELSPVNLRSIRLNSEDL